MEPAIPIPRDGLAAFCRRHHIRRLALFGSVLRDDFGPDSDIDVLVEFEPGHTPGWEIVALEDELGLLLGRSVDLRTPEELSRHWRQRVIDSAQVIHE
jgi:predicted nucleotidyltransferase